MKYLLFVFLIMLIACGESKEQQAEKVRIQDSIHRYDSLIKPRKRMYELAAGALRDRLKAPSTAKLPGAVTMQNTDTVRIAIDSNYAVVMFPYDAQNPMGTYLRGYAKVLLAEYSGGWDVVGAFGGEDYIRSEYDYFESSATEFLKNFRKELNQQK